MGVPAEELVVEAAAEGDADQVCGGERDEDDWLCVPRPVGRRRHGQVKVASGEEGQQGAAQGRLRAEHKRMLGVHTYRHPELGGAQGIEASRM